MRSCVSETVIRTFQILVDIFLKNYCTVQFYFNEKKESIKRNSMASTPLLRGDNHLGAPTVFTNSGVCYLPSDRCRYQVVTTSFLQSSFIRCDNVAQLNAWQLPCLDIRRPLVSFLEQNVYPFESVEAWIDQKNIWWSFCSEKRC